LLPYNIDISQGSVATHLRCGGIFSDSIITNFFLIQTVKSLRIGQYLIKLYMVAPKSKPLSNDPKIVLNRIKACLCN